MKNILRTLILFSVAIFCAGVHAQPRGSYGSYYADGIHYRYYYTGERSYVSAQNTNIEFAVIPEKIEAEGPQNGYIIPTDISNFKNCGSLQYVMMPSTIKEIGGNAFLNCSSLSAISISSSAVKIADDAFDGCGNLAVVYLPSGYDADAFPIAGGLMLVAESRGYDVYVTENVSEEQLNTIVAVSEITSNIENMESYEQIPEAVRQPLEKLLQTSYTFKVLSSMDDAVMQTYVEELNAAYEDVCSAVNIPKMKALCEKYLEARCPQRQGVPFVAGDGLITEASQITSNAKHPSLGSFENLIDANSNTYFRTKVSQDNSTEHLRYLQLDLKDLYRMVVVKGEKCKLGKYPEVVQVYVTNTPEDKDSWVRSGDAVTLDYAYDDGKAFLLPVTLGEDAYRYVIIDVISVTNDKGASSVGDFYLSELHVYASCDKTELLSLSMQSDLARAYSDAKKELDNNKATDATMNKLQRLLEKMENELASKGAFVDFSKSGYVTLYSDKDVKIPTGMLGAIVKCDEQEIPYIDYMYKKGSVVPAQTGLLLKSNQGNYFFMNEEASGEVSPEGNLLHGSLEDEQTKSNDALCKYYKLSYDLQTNSVIGFYWGAENGGTFINKAGKAYLALPVSAPMSTNGFSLDDMSIGNVTSIQSAVSARKSDAVFNLKGQYVGSRNAMKTQKGVYIIGGRKVLVR